jgi:hypothetical protein
MWLEIQGVAVSTPAPPQRQGIDVLVADSEGQVIGGCTVVESRRPDDRRGSNSLTPTRERRREVRVARAQTAAVVDRHGHVPYDATGEHHDAGADRCHGRSGRCSDVDAPVAGPLADGGERPHDRLVGETEAMTHGHRRKDEAHEDENEGHSGDRHRRATVSRPG